MPYLSGNLCRKAVWLVACPVIMIAVTPGCAKRNSAQTPYGSKKKQYDIAQVQNDPHLSAEQKADALKKIEERP